MTNLAVGDKAPNFKLPADNGKTINLADFKGKKNVVVYFYPKDDTPGCTIEAKEFRDAAHKFAKADTIVLGVSKDSVESHCKFRDKFDLNFNLVSDTGTMAEDYGVWVEKNMYGRKYMGIQRDTLLIDKQGKIAAIWQKVKPEGHPAEVLEAAKKLD
jgi:peroxiredoxin Q/BCP